MSMPAAAAVVAYRGNIPENRHALSIAVCDPSGRLLRWLGDPDRVTVLRSTAKPFQVQALLASDAPKRFGIGDDHVALACASHCGSKRHTELARELLACAGLTESALGCGSHPPEPATYHELVRAGQEPTAIHNNCSGKHAGMLATCVARGWPLPSYLDPDHPLQVGIREILEAVSGSGGMPCVVDGCSAPTYGMPLRNMARMFATLLAPSAAPKPLQPGLARACDAMRRYPELVAGDGVIDTVLMQRLPGLVAKRGAEAAYTLAFVAPGIGPVGVALKAEDGSNEARDCAVLEVLAQLGLPIADDPVLTALRAPVRRNCRDREVGRYVAQFTLAR